MIQQEVTTGKGKFLFVEIPESSVIFVCDMGYLIFKVPNYDTWIKNKDMENPFKMMKHLEKHKESDEWKPQYIKLPDGNYKFIGVTRSFLADRHEASQNLTEEIAAQIVDNNGMGCYDNYRLKNDEKYTCTTAMDSFKCLLETSNLKSEYAILKKID